MSKEERFWYAVYTRSRQEKQVAAYFQRMNLETFLPLRRTWSSRRDRKVTLELPAIPGYLFVRCQLDAETRALIKRATGVVYLVESVGRPAVIPDAQVESLRIALAAAPTAEGHPYLNIGDRVQVVRGPMKGVEGYLVRISANRHRLVIVVDHVNQALSVEVEGAWVEPAESSPPAPAACA